MNEYNVLERYMNKNQCRELDLNVENYSYAELLQLFQIEELNEINLKRAHKMTMQTHPDYSHMDQCYFLFFVKAFKYLKRVYDIQKKQETLQECVANEANPNYHTNLDQVVDKKIQKKYVEEQMKRDDYNEWFNQQFEKVFEQSPQDEGYEDWYRGSYPNKSEASGCSNVRDMHSRIEEEKQRQRNERGVVTWKDMDAGMHACNDGTQSWLQDEKLESYGSSIFSKLRYEDLKKAHTETVVPVSEIQDMRKEHYNNANELKDKRDQMVRTYHPLTGEHEEYIRRQQQEQNEEYTYRLLKDQEKSKNFQQNWWTNTGLLKNEYMYRQ